MTIKPWRNIATPHHDVLHGTFKQAEFAADITQVHTGTASPEYQDAEKFFDRTYITEGMRLLLTSVAQRLAGQGGDPVIQLQTAFGGGKTHTMLAVYHLATYKGATHNLHGIPPLLDGAGIVELPAARVAVIDGINLAPSEDAIKNSASGKKIKVNTLWGEIAYQLLGEAGLDLLRESHEQGTSPGKAILVNLLQQAAPCVILIDELVAYLRQFEQGRVYKAGTFDSNLSFIQALTEAMKAVPNAILLASLPESETEVGGTMGQLALTALEKYFARVESVWKPVDAHESFEIVRRRLFEHAGEPNEIREVCRQFHEFYRQEAGGFPKETQEGNYFERMCQSYPIHPEIFDRLYQDWSTLDKFQRTRGVLQYMAIIIHHLWQSGNADAMIMPGSIPLNDSVVRNKSIHYLPTGWEPVIEREVDGPSAVATEVDHDTSIYGSIQAARRVMRTIFLGSAPSNAGQLSRGIQVERILLGAMQPGQTVSIFEDVLKKLRDKLHYLYADQDRYWLDTKPNLRREMESRKQGLSELNDIQPLIKRQLEGLLNRSSIFSGIHVFTASQDIPDEYGIGPRLVILPTSTAFSRTRDNAAVSAAAKILRTRGEQPRQKQNRLIFLAADHDVVSRLREQARTFLAWRSIVKDMSDEVINYDLANQKQAKQHLAAAEKTFDQLLREAFKWLLVPNEVPVKGKPELEWEDATISTNAPNLLQEIERKLKEEEWLISEWSPIHLRNLLDKYYFKDDKQEVGALKVWQDTAHYLYLPRLVNSDVFYNTCREAIKTRDHFAMAAEKQDERYLGFSFGSQALITIDEFTLFIQKQAAIDYEAKLAAEEAAKNKAQPQASSSEELGAENGIVGTVYPSSGVDANVGEATPQKSVASIKKRFYGSVELDPVKAKLDFATIIDEVISQFTLKPGVRVNISVEVQADTDDGFNESVQRAVKENCSVLKFQTAEFEDE